MNTSQLTLTSITLGVLLFSSVWGLQDLRYETMITNWKVKEKGTYSCVEGELNEYRDQFVLPKTVYSDKKRAVFFAGLGGTGHHLYKQLMLICANHKACEESTFHDFVWRSKGTDGGMWNPKSEEARNRSYCIVKSELLKIASGSNHDNRDDANGRPVVVSVNPINEYQKGASGEMSYPNFFRHNSKHTPDVWLFGALSEKSGVDFRFLVLLRRPWDIVHSVLRRFPGSPVHTLVQRFANAQNKFLGQLKRMHPDFYTCSYLPNAVEYAPAVEKMLFSKAGVANNYHAEGRLSAALQVLIKTGPGTTTYTKNDSKYNDDVTVLIAEKLGDTFDAIVQLCMQNKVYGHFKPIPWP